MKNAKDVIAELVAWLGAEAENIDKAAGIADFLGDSETGVYLNGKMDAYHAVVVKIQELLDDNPHQSPD